MDGTTKEGQKELNKILMALKNQGANYDTALIEKAFWFAATLAGVFFVLLLVLGWIYFLGRN